MLVLNLLSNESNYLLLLSVLFVIEQFALWDNAYILNGHQAKDNQRVPILIIIILKKSAGRLCST